MAKDSRGLQIDTNFFQQVQPVSSPLHQRHKRHSSASVSHNTDSLVFHNNSQHTAIVSMENTVKTLILKQLFASWAKLATANKLSQSLKLGLRKKYQIDRNTCQGLLYDFQFEDSLEKGERVRQPNLNHQQISRRQKKDSIRTQRYSRGQKYIFQQQKQQDGERWNQHSRYKKKDQSINVHSKTQAKSESEQLYKNLKMSSKKPESIYQRLNLHISQMKQINHAFSLSQDSSRQRQYSNEHNIQRERRSAGRRYGNQSQFRDRRYRSLGDAYRMSSEESAVISESRALILKEIVEKLKNQGIGHSRQGGYSLSFQFGRKRSRYTVRDRILQQLKRQKDQYEGTQFEQRIDYRLNRLEKMMMNIKRQHLKIEGGRTVEKTRMRITRKQNQRNNSLYPNCTQGHQSEMSRHGQRHQDHETSQDYQKNPQRQKTRNQSSKQTQHFKLQLQKLKQELQAVKISNNNIQNYTKSIQNQSQYNPTRKVQKQSTAIADSQVSNQLTNRREQAAQRNQSYVGITSRNVYNQQKRGKNQAISIPVNRSIINPSHSQMGQPSNAVQRSLVYPECSNYINSGRPASLPPTFYQKNSHYQYSAVAGQHIPFQRQTGVSFVVLSQPTKVRSNTVFRSQNHSTQSAATRSNRIHQNVYSDIAQQYIKNNSNETGNNRRVSPMPPVFFGSKIQQPDRHQWKIYNGNDYLPTKPHSFRQNFTYNPQLNTNSRQEHYERIKSVDLGQNHSSYHLSGLKKVSLIGNDNNRNLTRIVNPSSLASEKILDNAYPHRKQCCGTQCQCTCHSPNQ